MNFCQSVNSKIGIGCLKSTNQLFLTAGVPLDVPQAWQGDIGCKIIAYLPCSAMDFIPLTALGSCSHLLSPSFEIILFLLQYKDPLIYNVVLAYAILTLLLNEVCVPGSKLVASYTDLCCKHFRSQRKKTEHAVTEDIKRLCCYS